MYFTTEYQSPAGIITIASDGTKLSGLWIEGQKYHGNILYDQMTPKEDIAILHQTKKWLDRYFSGKKPAISELSLAPNGSSFRKDVWHFLCEIPYGEVVTYGDIAKKMAKKMNRQSMSSQAVGGAIGHNPISIIIPCHRVVGTNGSLTGYAGGIDKKIKLLELEEVDMSGFFIPKKGTAL